MNLENVQVGDTLIWNGRHLADSRIVKVTRLTKTQIIIGTNRYRKSDGKTVGGGSVWSSNNVRIPEDGEIEKIREAQLHQKLVNQIDDACQINKLRDMPLCTLQEINEVLETL